MRKLTLLLIATFLTTQNAAFAYLTPPYVSSFNGRIGAVMPAAGDYTSDDVSEGSNLYWTQVRFDAAFGAKSSSDLAEGTNLYYTQGRFDSAFSAKSAVNLAYTPTVSGDWSWASMPGSVLDALDSIANYIKNTLATKTYADLTPGGLPSGVLVSKGNKVLFQESHDGLLIQSEDSTGQANLTGAFNGGGLGQKAIVGFDNYDNLLFSGLTALSFNVKTLRDANTQSVWGNVYWNLLGNFNSGVLTAASDYVNLVFDGAPAMMGTNYFITTGSYADYSVDLVNGRSLKAIGGTGSISLTGDCTSGSPTITNLSNAAALTVGMNLRVNFLGIPSQDLTCIPDGSVINSINVGANSLVLDHNATATAVTQALRQYGGIAPVSRTGVTVSGSATITGISNTADLLVNMAISGVGIPANSYILSMVANTSITIGNSVSALATATGSPTLSFVAIGKTGIPSNVEHVGITWAKAIALNPNATLLKTIPTVAGGWAAADGGWPKNGKMSAINFIMGGSGTTDARTVALKSATINSDVYTFAR